MNISPHILTNWEKFHQAASEGKKAKEMGFPGCDSKREIIMLASRYRVAKSFRGVVLEEYSQKTLDGYSALFRLFLAWSTFEQFLRILGLQQRQIETKNLFDEYGAIDLCEFIKKQDSGKTFYSFLLSQCSNKDHTNEIQKHFVGKEINATFLVSSIRHIFAHGKLTPHSGKSCPRKTAKMCNKISDFVLHIIDCEFAKRFE